MNVSAELARQVRSRAKGRCEYCRMHESLQGATFHVEHVLPRSLGGQSTLDNLAWACPSCNLHKSDRITAPNPETSESVPLFDPRRDSWETHLKFSGYEINGKTEIGKALIAAFQMNHERRQKIRQAEALFNLFPPES